MSVQGNLERAIEIVQKAIEHDTKQNYAEAYKYYHNSLDYFMLAVKYEQNIKSRELLIAKVEEYLRRAEALKEYLFLEEKGRRAIEGGAAGPTGKQKPRHDDRADQEAKKLHPISTETPNVKSADVSAKSTSKEDPDMAKCELELASSGIPIFENIESYRSWRKKAFIEGKSVGYVATMGALHEGHLSLVRRSLIENDLTVVSIFVNPAQFAPTEDLETYPRTLPEDVKLLEGVQDALPRQVPGETTTLKRTVSAIFAPSVSEMYPSGIVQDVAKQKGTFVEVNGYGHQMEGSSRPMFFRGVATVVTKLFNVIQPDNAYFGQKDIQQALLLKRLCRDLLLAYPEHQNLHIVPTARENDGLALSSRNLYLTSDGRAVAATLRSALIAAESAWSQGLTKSKCIECATLVVNSRKEDALALGLHVEMRLDYIQMNYADSFEVLESDVTKGSELVILSGALYVDKTRLIDNILLGDAEKVLQ